MREGMYKFLAAREDQYWWHRARREMVSRLLQRYGVSPRLRWLDLGCGPGGNLCFLDAESPELIVGIDLSIIALELARLRGTRAQLVRADISRTLPFANSTFDLVTSFNVLYHAWVGDENAVLVEIRRVLRSGGLMVATEPAFSVLARAMDVAVMARRRYRSREFATICRSAGFDILSIGYFTSFGFPIILASKMLKRLPWLRRKSRGGDEVLIDMQPLSRLTNGFMFWIAKAEASAIARGIRMPFGTTLVCCARKA
jgi:SAM-dependent methyltransferase